MTTAEEVKQDIDANWEGVYAALQAVVRLEKRVGKIEELLDELPDRIISQLRGEMGQMEERILAEIRNGRGTS